MLNSLYCTSEINSYNKLCPLFVSINNRTFTPQDPMGDVWAKFPEVHYMSMGLGNYWRYQAIAGEVGDGQKVGGATSPKS